MATIVAVAYLAGAPWLLPVLTAGFALRVGWGPRFSPLARLATTIAPRLGEPRMVAGPPKRFAQALGVVFTGVATLMWATGNLTIAWGIGGLIVAFAIIEAAFAFCMGCWLYGKLQAAGVFPAEACADCTDVARRARRASSMLPAVKPNYGLTPKPPIPEPEPVELLVVRRRPRTSPTELSGL